MKLITYLSIAELIGNLAIFILIPTEYNYRIDDHPFRCQL